jgi:hypothetical protein
MNVTFVLDSRIVAACIDTALLQRDLAQLKRQAAAAPNGRTMPRSVLDFDATAMALAGISQRQVGQRFGREPKDDRREARRCPPRLRETVQLELDRGLAGSSLGFAFDV